MEPVVEEVQDIQERMEKLEKITKENNKILHKLRNHMRMGTIMRVLYWGVIIGSMVGTYYYLQPFIEPFMDIYDTLIKVPEVLKDVDLSNILPQ